MGEKDVVREYRGRVLTIIVDRWKQNHIEATLPGCLTLVKRCGARFISKSD